MDRARDGYSLPAVERLPLPALAPVRRGPKAVSANPLATRAALLEQDNARLTRAEAVIDVQKSCVAAGDTTGSQRKRALTDAVVILACSLGFVLGVLPTPANVHDTAAAGPLLDRAAEQSWKPVRANVDGIYT